MAAIGELLFYRRDQVTLGDTLRQRVEHLRQSVDGLPDKLFSDKTDQDIATEVARSAMMVPLDADFHGAKANVDEVQVEVRDSFAPERGPVPVPGLRATKTITFKGDPDLWMRPINPFDTNPPRGEVRGQRLVIGIELPTQQADQAKRYIDETMASIPKYLDDQKAMVQQHNDSLPGAVMPWIRQRRARLSQAADLLGKLQG